MRSLINTDSEQRALTTMADKNLISQSDDESVVKKNFKTEEEKYASYSIFLIGKIERGYGP